MAVTGRKKCAAVARKANRNAMLPKEQAVAWRRFWKGRQGKVRLQAPMSH